MTENTPEQTQTPAQEQPPANSEQTPTSWDDLFKDEDPAKVREALDNSRKWETRAKANADAARQLAEVQKQQRAALPEAERAVAEAEARGRSAATAEFGQRLVRTKFDALAGRRNADFDTSQALEYLDLAKFVGDDGEPDEKAIAAAVERLVPQAAPAAPSFDGGARKATPVVSMNDLIRRQVGRQP